MGNADLHVHTSFSDGLPSVAQVLLYVEEQTALDIVAITDHDTIEGALRARDLAAREKYRCEVIVGCEVTTRQGHLLALYLEKPVRSLRPVRETVAAVHDQGGICIAPHPLSWLTRSLGAGTLERLQADPEDRGRLDGMEIWNPSIAGRVTRDRAIALNGRFGLAETGSSDAHFLPHIGTAYTVFEGRTGSELRAAIASRQTVARRADPLPQHAVPTRQLARQQVRSLIELPARRVGGYLRRRWQPDPVSR